MLKALFLLLSFPLVIPWQVYKRKGNRLLRLMVFLLSSFVLLPLWLLALFSLVFMITVRANRLGVELGLVTETVYVSGTGSMYPTFPKGVSASPTEQANELVAAPRMRRFPGGFSIFGYPVLKYQLQRGDIINFVNARTSEITQKEYGHPSGFIKRAVALPGDTVEIRNGYLWLNGQRLVEPYTASPRSTFGGQFLPDCQKITVPGGKVLALGDNRKGSSDSRHEIGYVEMQDIVSVQTLSQQLPYRHLWRDSSRDFETASQPTLDPDKYRELLNKKRQENNLAALADREQLRQSAAKRADVILKYNDLSFEATRSGYTMAKALSEVGYSNIIWGEAPTIGYYEAEELLENYFEFPATKKFLLDKDFQETGLAVKMGEINGCPVQVIVQHLAGYVPPNYKAEDLNSWREALGQLETVSISWLKLKNYEGIDHARLDRLLDLFNQEKTIAEATLKKMEANQWLTKSEEAAIERYGKLLDQSHSLATELNQQISNR
ncbi:MAG: signal peptidase I [Patescibacteria group bacterium]